MARLHDGRRTRSRVGAGVDLARAQPAPAHRRQKPIAPPAGAKGLAALGHRRRRRSAFSSALIALWQIGRGLRLDRRLFLVEAERDLRHADQVLHRRRRLDRYQLHLPLDDLRLSDRHDMPARCSACRSGGRAIMPRSCSPTSSASNRLPKLALAPLVILVFGLGLASKVAIATALTLVVSTLTAYAGVKARRYRSGKAVLFARRQPHAGVPQAGRAVLPAVDHFGAAGEYRARADRRHRRRIHRLAARPRPRKFFTPARPTTSRWSGSRCSCSRPCRRHVCAVSWLESILRKGVKQ